MIETCMTPNCYSAPAVGSKFCTSCIINLAGSNYTLEIGKVLAVNTQPPTAPEPRNGRRVSDNLAGENSGGDVDYYRVFIADPKRSEPYMAECEDIIEHLNMTFAEGTAFKSIWRKAAQRTLGHLKRGNDQHGIRDSEKVEYYGKRMTAQAKREAKKGTAENVRDSLIDELVKQTSPVKVKESQQPQ